MFRKTPPTSPRSARAQEARREANGIFAPARKGFEGRRNEVVENYVTQELKKYDLQQGQEKQENDEENSISHSYSSRG